MVSNNKKKCLDCMALEVFDAVKERGQDPDMDDIRRLIRVHA